MALTSFYPHCRIRFKREFYLKLPLDESMKGRVSPRAFYANFTGQKPLFIEDFILRVGDGMPSPDEQTKSRDFFSIANGHMLFLTITVLR